LIELPRLYPILDADALARNGVPLAMAAYALRDAGVRWLQYRDKRASDAEVVERMRELRAIFPAGEAMLLLNDRVHLCDAVGADGVQAFALADGRAAAFKIEDGSARARDPITVALLRRLGVTTRPGVPDSALDEIGAVPVLGGSRAVGVVRAILPG